MKEDRRLAYHEAGHAVAAFACWIPYRRVWIGERAFDGYVSDGQLAGANGGLAGIERRVEEGRSPTPKQADLVRRQITIAYAGPIAEMTHLGVTEMRTYGGKGSDRERIERLHRLLPDEELAALQAQAQGLVRTYWSWIEAVADALVARRSLSRAQVEQVMRETAAD
jgi:hypothetical protein